MDCCHAEIHFTKKNHIKITAFVDDEFGDLATNLTVQANRTLNLEKRFDLIMEKMVIQEIQNERQEKDINDLKPKKTISVNATIENKIQEIEHMLEASPTSECPIFRSKLNELNTFVITVPRLCSAYGDVFGFYTINPKNMAGRASKFKALCINGKIIKGVFTCSILTSIVTILVSIVVKITSIKPILEKCVHLQVQYLRLMSQYLYILKQL